MSYLDNVFWRTGCRARTRVLNDSIANANACARHRVVCDVWMVVCMLAACVVPCGRSIPSHAREADSHATHSVNWDAYRRRSPIIEYFMCVHHTYFNIRLYARVMMIEGSIVVVICWCWRSSGCLKAYDINVCVCACALRPAAIAKSAAMYTLCN